MKIIHRNHTLSESNSSEILAKADFSAPNAALPHMKKALNPNHEHFVSVNHFEEEEPFLLTNIIVETIRMMDTADGFITDQIFLEHHHHIDGKFVNELSKIIGDRHFIVGPSFSRIPAFLQSRLLDELIDADVSGVMYDVRDIDPDDFASLQPLAKLKIHAKKRLTLIPVVASDTDRKRLLRNIPFEVVCISEE